MDKTGVEKTGNAASESKPSVTLPGTVEKVIESQFTEPEKAEISVQGADDLYKEIRIENTMQDGEGKEVKLKAGAEVKVTIEAEPEATIPKETQSEKPESFKANSQ